MSFKTEFSFDERKTEANRVCAKYKDRVPVICERLSNSNIQQIDKKKYLIPNDLTCGQFLFVIRRRLKLDSDKALYLFIDGKIPSNNEMIQVVYDKYKSSDGFLYVNYSDEMIFG